MPQRYAHLFLLVLALLLGGCEDKKPAGRITTENYLTAIPDPKALGEAYVSDPDSVLQPATVAALNAQLTRLDQRGRAHIDVVVVQSIGEEVPKMAATALFNRWKIGDPQKNNGLLMLLVMDQRRVEFETGYGLEADLPDITCYRIQQQHMVPELRAGRTDAAVQAGVDALIRELGGPADTTPAYLAQANDDNDEAAQADSADPGTIRALPEGVTVRPPGLDEAVPDVAVPGEVYSQAYPGGNQNAKRAPELRQRPLDGWGGPLLMLSLVGLMAGIITLVFRGADRKLWLLTLSLVAAGLVALAVAYFSLLAQVYLLPLVVAHGYFLYLYYRTHTPEWQALSRQQQYQSLVDSHHNKDFTAYLFPLVLRWYWPWHRRRLARLRDLPYTCPECAQPMRKLDDTAEDAYLKPGELAEEVVTSFDYDVWQCANGHLLQLAYHNPGSPASKCPACHYETLLLSSTRQMKAATTSSSGWGWHTYSCKACQHTKQEKYTIARISSSSSGGGGSSSGSSSSGSRSSSSGGSSGGGGAGSSW